MSQRIRRVAVAAAGGCLLAASLAGAAAAAPIGAYTTAGAWKFVSAPSLHPPKLTTDARTVASRLALGDFLVDSFPNVAASGPMIGEGGPLILDSRLRPVWVQPAGTTVVSADLQQETYDGQPVLVWWRGLITKSGATESGQVVVVDQHYRTLATLRASAPWLISIHDAVISGSTIWVTVYRYAHGQNLKRYGGSRSGTVFDSGVQAYDLKTGRLLYTWDPLKGGPAGVPLAESEQPASAPTAPHGAWDAYHVNSVQVLANGEILVSMRNTWAAYLIDTGAGRIVWRLGGRRSSFSLPSKARFAWQHDVGLLPDGEVTLYDDACCRELGDGSFAPASGQSRGLVLRVDAASRRASLVAAYPHRPARASVFLGSMQRLDNGNALVGWGSLPYFSEYSPSGRLLLDAVWPGKDQSYRALFTSDWVGTPYYPPSGAARTSRGRTTVFASWNGATQVARWEILAGPSAAQLTTVATVPKNGFETSVGLGTRRYQAFRVIAVDAQGSVLGTSGTFSG